VAKGPGDLKNLFKGAAAVKATAATAKNSRAIPSSPDCNDDLVELNQTVFYNNVTSHVRVGAKFNCSGPATDASKKP
jgi:hypothetical protein